LRVLHPDLSQDERDRLFREGIDLFDQGRFFEAHEAWEEIWRSTTPEPKGFFQGLIQVAAALHQFRDLKRRDGPRRTLAKARRNLEPYVPSTLGIDVEGLLRSVGEWDAWIGSPQGNAPDLPVLNPKPKI
jgi:predicted metal-dependent hydrolase